MSNDTPTQTAALIRRLIVMAVAAPLLAGCYSPSEAKIYAAIHRCEHAGIAPAQCRIFILSSGGILVGARDEDWRALAHAMDRRPT